MRRLVVCAILLTAALWLAAARAAYSPAVYRQHLPIVAAPTLTPLPTPATAPQWPAQGSLTPSAGHWDGPECITCDLP